MKYSTKVSDAVHILAFITLYPEGTSPAAESPRVSTPIPALSGS